MNSLGNVPRVPRRMPSGSPFVMLIVVVVVILFLMLFARNFFYAFERVDEQEVGVQFQGGRSRT